LRSQALSDIELYPDSLRTELGELPRPHPSFVVSLLTREEAAIQGFREQIVAWWGQTSGKGQTSLTDRLRSLENETFFQAFGELAIHEILRHHEISVRYEDGQPEGWLTAQREDLDPISLGVISYLPEVQIRGSLSVYRHLVRELNQIHHHYHFSVYLKRWLPYDFDPRPIKRALEMWLDSLDDGSWHGKYAEYRDANIHLEFSILDKLQEDARSLVKFRISPLRAPDVLAKLQQSIDTLLSDSGDHDHGDRPLVATVFSNEDWALPEAFLSDFLYGKADYSFTWTTHGGRNERLKQFQKIPSKYGVFSDGRYSRLSAVVLADKEWERDKVVFSLRVLHNPWASHPLSPDCFADFAQYRTIETDGDISYLAWNNQHRSRFRLA